MKIGTQAEFREWLSAHQDLKFKRSICGCPIALWLEELNQRRVVVDGTLARLARIDFLVPSTSPLYHELPVWAKTFITRFDKNFNLLTTGKDALQYIDEAI